MFKITLRVTASKTLGTGLRFDTTSNCRIPIQEGAYKQYLQLSGRRIHDDAHGHPNLYKFKLAKRLFWTVMFGGTFAATVLVRRKRRIEAEEFLQHYQSLPSDLNFKDGGKSFRYKGFVFPQAFGKKVFRDIEKFQAREDDVYVVSFPKTGESDSDCDISNELVYEKLITKGTNRSFFYLE